MLKKREYIFILLHVFKECESYESLNKQIMLKI